MSIKVQMWICVSVILLKITNELINTVIGFHLQTVKNQIHLNNFENRLECPFWMSRTSSHVHKEVPCLQNGTVLESAGDFCAWAPYSFFYSSHLKKCDNCMNNKTCSSAWSLRLQHVTLMWHHPIVSKTFPSSRLTIYDDKSLHAAHLMQPTL